MEDVLQPSDQLHGPYLDLFQEVHALSVLGTPGLDAVLQVQSHEGGAEGQNPLSSAVPTALDAAQGTIGFVGCKCTLPGHAELLISHHPQVLLLRAAIFPSQPVSVLEIALTHV